MADGPRTEPGTAAHEEDTVDAFHRGAFHIVQPARQGHRSGMDAMLLAALVHAEGPFRLADLGAGAGAAGLAVAARLDRAEVSLVERSPVMVAYARRSLDLPGNDDLKRRTQVIEADVTLTGRARVAAGLADDHFDQVILNPPFNHGADRRTPDALKAEAHAMHAGLFEDWIRTAGAILKPGGQMSLIARPESIAEIIAACGRRFGGLEVTALHPREGADAVRILVTAIKQSRARLRLRAPLIMHREGSNQFTEQVDDLNNGRAAYRRTC
ncbi:methyltransferase [Xaviernesmea oryzae]|uniref:Methyltransferase n=1 Tax=Xaviernesmea oryzae TaxID=464029 RepID=A0A1Q9ATQ7_9HYPH|nr:methyltransferase [Xaviernesmea oryzae]